MTSVPPALRAETASADAMSYRLIIVLAFVAGYVDAFGFVALFGLFTAHVTADMTPGVNRDRFSVFSFQTHVVSEFPEGDAASKSRRWITLISAGWLPHYRGPPNEPAAI
jgi:hypothetical protein